MLDLTLIVLTYNEEKQIARCLTSASGLVKKTVVIDSLSTDQTLTIAQELGAEVYQNPWPGNQARQFNWALTHVPLDTEWVLRLDADEYLLPQLVEEIKQVLPTLDASCTGLFLRRRVHFMGQWIRYGGYYPTKILRIWRRLAGKLEEKWMDEHVKLDYGQAITLTQDFVDDNQNNLTWWTQKHNQYATREAVELLNLEFNFTPSAQIDRRFWGSQEQRKRWFKELFYFKIPLFIRPFLYFLFRYFFKFGFRDGVKGLIWHFLQGFWYRFLVDAKIYDIKRLARQNGRDIKAAVEEYLQAGAV
jgi:glycosyltransferase involved in cell wall biosynthesis